MNFYLIYQIIPTYSIQIHTHTHGPATTAKHTHTHIRMRSPLTIRIHSLKSFLIRNRPYTIIIHTNPNVRYHHRIGYLYCWYINGEKNIIRRVILIFSFVLYSFPHPYWFRFSYLFWSEFSSAAIIRFSLTKQCTKQYRE